VFAAVIFSACAMVGYGTFGHDSSECPFPAAKQTVQVREASGPSNWDSLKAPNAQFGSRAVNAPSDLGSHIPASFREEVIVERPASVVWKHLVDLHSMREWLGGDDYSVEVETTWVPRNAIVIRGTHHLPFEAKGVVLAFQPCEALSFTHLSSLSRLPDQPSSYTKLSFVIQAEGHRTVLKFEASQFPTMAIYRHLHFYWAGTLEIFKRYAESQQIV
jgi:uncharacterized protein YndB with AHSA1/START domain